MKHAYANIVISTHIDGVFTYIIPDYLQNDVKKGSRVLVPFGNRSLTGFVISLSDATSVANLKSIHSVLDAEPVLTDDMIEFGKWISEYYISPLGEVLSMFIPQNISVHSEVIYCLTDDSYSLIKKLKKPNDIVFDIIKIISESKSKALTRKQIENKTGSNLSYYIEYLVKNGVLEKKQSYSSVTKEAFVKFVKLSFDKNLLDDTITSEKIRIERQKEMLKLLSESEKIELNDLVKKYKFSASTVNSLLKKGLVQVVEVKKHRKPESYFHENHKELKLNDEQQYCFDEITGCLSRDMFRAFLLFGITGSGKTEVYIRALEHVINSGKTGIVLVPEISLTPQLISRFRNKFGSIIGVIHSKLSEGERLDIYIAIREGRVKIVIGPRSALFAPLKNIGLIVVDEEHEVSYKQENSPRYNARDMAIVRGKMNNAVVILGSATPSVESYYNAKSGKYKLLTLKTRATEASLPYVKIIDLKNAPKPDGFMKDTAIESFRARFLSKELLYAVRQRIEKKESVILLQNRRGYHSYIECVSCGHVEMCVRCNISLTYHKHIDYLKCHICGFAEKKISTCKECGSPKLIESGAGTEKIEEELNAIFPAARIERMDSDTMTSKFKYQKILNEFSKGEIDILVGTQIISKGLDFPNVTLVGVVNADIGMLLPDFRAEERTFQLLTQVAGRSGRSDKRGEVFIQTRHYEYKLFDNVREHNYESFYYNTIKTREDTGFPPFSRIAVVEIKSKDFEAGRQAANDVFNELKKFRYSSYLYIGNAIQPLISKIKDKFRFHVIVKSPKKTDPAGKLLTDALNFARQNIAKESSIKITYDIDSYSFI